MISMVLNRFKCKLIDSIKKLPVFINKDKTLFIHYDRMSYFHIPISIANDFRYIKYIIIHVGLMIWDEFDEESIPKVCNTYTTTDLAEVLKVLYDLDSKMTWYNEVSYMYNLLSYYEIQMEIIFEDDTYDIVDGEEFIKYYLQCNMY